jgi:hypothetical protein
MLLFGYCYHSDNVISISLSQSDHNKWLPLYEHLIKLLWKTTRCSEGHIIFFSKYSGSRFMLSRLKLIVIVA